jgi:chemotaxis protein CheD
MKNGNANIEIHVKIAELKTGHDGETLRAVLGSCVGIAFLWRRKKIYALAHCLLPETENISPVLSAKFINLAIPNLMSLMKISTANVAEIEVHIAGGANMLAQLSRKNIDEIGRLNIAAAKKHLSLYGFKISSENVGGFCGRQIYLNCTDESVQVDLIEKAA